MRETCDAGIARERVLTVRELPLRGEELQMVSCKGHVRRSKGFFQIRSFLGPTIGKTGNGCPSRGPSDDFSQIVTGLRLEILDPFVPIFVLLVMKQGLHKVGRLRNAAVIQSAEISVCLRGVGKCREAMLGVPINTIHR